jgi:hypothetical protein
LQQPLQVVMSANVTGPSVVRRTMSATMRVLSWHVEHQCPVVGVPSSHAGPASRTAQRIGSNASVIFGLGRRLLDELLLVHEQR